MLRTLNLVFALAGVVICAVLLRMGAGGLDAPGDAFSASVCAPSRSVNCDYVLASPWARVGPLPTAAVGFGYFAALAAWYGFVGVPNPAGRRWQYVPVSVTLIGLAGSIYYVYIMAVMLPVWCTWCLAGHAVNAALFLGTMAVARRLSVTNRPEGQSARPTAARALGVLGGSAAMVLMFSVAVVAYQAQAAARRFQLEYLSATNNAAYIQWRHGQAPLAELPIEEDDLVLGPADAPHTVVAFTDFECAKCGWFHRYAEHLLNRFSGRVRLVVKHYPVCQACNPHVKTPFHYFSCEAARAAQAALAAGTPELAYKYHGALYATQSRLAIRPYEGLAVRVGFDPAKFSGAMESDASANAVQGDIELAHSIGVDSTPAVFLDGRQLPTWHILTADVQPRIDVTATDELWRALLSGK